MPVKFNNKSLLHYQIDLFKKRISQIYVITGYKSNKIKSNDIKKFTIKIIKTQIWFLVFYSKRII